MAPFGENTPNFENYPQEFLARSDANLYSVLKPANNVNLIPDQRVK